MTTYELIGFFWTILSVCVFTAAVMITSGFGAWTLWRTWKVGEVVEQYHQMPIEPVELSGIDKYSNQPGRKIR